MRLHTLGQMINDPLYGQISYNSSLSNDFKLNLGQDVKLFLVQMKPATGKEIAEHIRRPGKEIAVSLVIVRYAHTELVYIDLEGTQ